MCREKCATASGMESKKDCCNSAGFPNTLIVVRYLERLAASITAMIYNSLEFFLTSSLFV
jgi:hypothetical protein